VCKLAPGASALQGVRRPDVPIHSSAFQAKGTRKAERPRGTAHARRVMQVGSAFAELPGPDHGPSALAEVMGIDVAAVFRVLQSGLDCKHIQRNPSGKYRLGPSVALMGTQAMAYALDLAATRPVLEKLGQDTGGLVVLSALVPYGGPGRQIVACAGRYGLSALGLGPDDLLSVINSLRVGASGRVMLAHLPRHLREMALTQPIPAGAGPGARRRRSKVADLETVRRQGYATGREELNGWDSVAAPVRWDSALVGAVSTLRPSALMRADKAQAQHVIAETVAAAERLSELASGVSTPQIPLAG